MNHPQTEETIFAATLELPPEERAAYLDVACGKDNALRKRIELLLNALEQSGAFLEESAAATHRAPSLNTSTVAEKPGDRIGRYKLLQQIGEGGCGVVYMAEQEEPVRRRVALKVIKLGMDTRQVIARFEAERQALALMDHPNIAKVLDVGATETGRPFFVMELVRGVKITEYCDQNNLPTRKRLELFIHVCRAIQHAHQKGVIHRDIKPSNIIVTLHDGVPIPKVIDFGIAKATQGRLTDRTVFTAFEQFIGTPAYMSPEQAEMSGLDIDTRSDIYSLGVLLYELLTGGTPFDSKELLAAGLEAMRRTIREKEPERPSTRLSTMLEGELSLAARHRCSDVPRLVSAIRGDLDWIVMKCLEKDRTRRYETANGLTAEIQRHLNQEPVLACPPTKLYRFQKLVRRNKVAFAAGLSVAIALVIGLSIAAWMFFQERAALKRAVTAEQEQIRLRQEAQANEKKAQSEAAKSREVARFLRSMLSGVGPSAAKGRDTTILREILDTTAERVRNELSAQPGVEADLRITIGSVYHDLFDFKKAEQMDREAVRLRTALFGRTNELVADALCQLAFTLVYIDPAEAETRARESLAIRRGLFGTNHINVAFSLNILAAALAKQGKHAEAETVYRQGLEMSERAPGDHELNDAIMLYNLGIDLYERGKLSEAETAAREALAIERKRFEVNHPTVADTLNLLAKALRRQGEPAKLPEAETFAREALKINKKIFGDTHFQVAESLEELGFILSDEGKLTECESTFREWLSVNKQLGAQAEVASSLFNLGALLKQEGKVAEAETNYRGALAMSRELGDTNLSMLYSGANLAAMLQEQGRLAAEGADIYKGLPDTAHQVRVLLLGEWMDEVFVRERNLSDAEGRISGALGLSAASLSTNLTFLKTRAQRLARRGHWQEAAADFGCAINLSPDDNELWHSLAVVLVQSGQVDAYREHCRKAIEHFKNTVESATADRIAKDCLILPSSGVDPKTLANLADTSVTREIGPERAYVQFCKGLAEYRQGNLTSALAWVEKALTKEGEVPERDVEACAVRSMACHRLGQPEIALAALTKGKELADRKLAKPGTDDLGEGWVDWIIAQALLREAKELIESPFATAKDRGR